MVSGYEPEVLQEVADDPEVTPVHAGCPHLARNDSPFFWRDDLDDSAPHAVLFDPLDKAVETSVAFKVFHGRFKHGHALEPASPAVSSLGSGGSGIVRLVVVVRRSRFRQPRRFRSLYGAGRLRFA